MEAKDLRAIERLVTLAKLVTVRQAIEAGDEAIEAAGLNPWCINEGLATGDERVHLWWAGDLQARAAIRQATGEGA